MEGHRRKTWSSPWSYREGTIITLVLIVAGFCFQAASGGAELRMTGFPWNLFSGLVFLLFLTLIFLRWEKHWFIKWLAGVKAALPAILGFTFLVLLMGFIRQDVQPANGLIRLLGLTHIVRTWPFILINIYLLVLLGLVTLARSTPFNLKNTGFFLNHFGLFVVLFSTSLGSSDVRRLTMNCFEGRSENWATDESGHVTILPFSIRLADFSIDEFRPKIVLANSKTGEAIQHKGIDLIATLDKDTLQLGDYRIERTRFFSFSEGSGDEYVEANLPGAVVSAKLKVTNIIDHSVVSGWVCCGNYRWAPKTMNLGPEVTLVLLQPEPRKFRSVVEIEDGGGKKTEKIIEVNSPSEFGGWKIYQLGYDTEMGRWSNLSTLQLVRDPWLPVVYTGIFLMMAGAAFLFISGKPKEGGVDHVA